MKIILADDERLVRVSMQVMLEELEQQGIVENLTMCHAVDGNELMEAVRTTDPHAAFVDIRMPGLSGLEAIEQAARTYPDIYWVVLTGYAHFDYARKAIALGVSEYLLKPASSEELSKVMVSVSTHWKKKVTRDSASFANRISALINNTLSSEFDPFLSKTNFRYYGLILYADSVGPGTDAADTAARRRFSGEVQELIEAWSFERSPEGSLAALSNTGRGNLLITLAVPEAAAEALLSPITGLFERARNSSIPELYLTGVPIPPENSAARYVEALEELELASEIRNQGSVRPGANKRQSQIHQALWLINRKPLKDISLSLIADELGLTPNYLSAEFKRHMGVSFTDYVTSLRMKQAAEKLGEPGMTVRKTALELGYFSSRHFSRVFQAAYGLKPSEYIENKQITPRNPPVPPES